MFQIGEQVVHYKEGVCTVTKIGRLDMDCSDKEKQYYTLKPVFNEGGTLYIPVSGKKEQLRKVMNREEANELIEQMPQIGMLKVSDEKKRESAYREALFKNESQSWVALIKTSYHRKKERMDAGKKVINIDNRYLSNAENFLFGELSVALDMPKEEVKLYIKDQILA